MRYQLPTGICVEINIDTYLTLSDDDIQALIADNQGLDYDDPFAASILKYGEFYVDEDVYTDFEDEEIKDLLSLDPNEKIMDEDFINIDELEL
ncbi:MAG TPA: hypothetical protein P5513_05145 [Candidatus Diapherotrites archaeon]|nr:hypothetical protein [Candidatus Diapherotrites archaeon]